MHPTYEEGKVNLDVCFVKKGDTCFIKKGIEVHNCCGFFVYKLEDTPFESLRYCVEKGRFSSPYRKTCSVLQARLHNERFPRQELEILHYELAVNTFQGELQKLI